MASVKIGRRPVEAVLGVACALALGVAACGGSDSSSSNSASSGGNSGAAGPGLKEAKSLVTKAQAPVGWKEPGPAVTNASQVQGKTLFYIAAGLNTPFTQGVVRGLKGATAALGMKLVVTGGGDPATAARLMEQGIGRHADAIAVQAFEINSLSAPIKAAKAAGIPVIMIEQGEPAMPTAQEKNLGVGGLVSASFAFSGRSIAQLATAETNGKANVVAFDAPEAGINQPYVEALKTEFARLCEGCKLKITHAPLAQWQTGLPGLTTSALKADPNVNFIIPLFDGMVATTTPSVLALNKQDSVKIASWDGDSAVLQNVQKGGTPVMADGGSPLPWYGWAIVDQTIRVMTGMDPVADENIPSRLFTKDNTQGLQLVAGKEGSWYGTADYEAEYKKLWGLQ
jgi:ribose transport system substrate-binding protein